MGGEDLAGACIHKHMGPIEGFLGVDIELPGESGPRLTGHGAVPYHQFTAGSGVAGIAIFYGWIPGIDPCPNVADGVFQGLAGRA